MGSINLLIIVFNMIVFSASLFLVLRFRHLYDRLMAVFYVVLILICIYQLNAELYATQHFMAYRITVGAYSLLFFYKHFKIRKGMRVYIKDRDKKNETKQ